jgi:hypothetical protein
MSYYNNDSVQNLEVSRESRNTTTSTIRKPTFGTKMMGKTVLKNIRKFWTSHKKKREPEVSFSDDVADQTVLDNHLCEDKPTGNPDQTVFLEEFVRTCIENGDKVPDYLLQYYPDREEKVEGIKIITKGKSE